jgi:hypothetical protein
MIPEPDSADRFGAADLHVIGGFLDGGPQHGVGRQAEDVVDPLRLAEGHHLRAAVMALTGRQIAVS